MERPVGTSGLGDFFARNRVPLFLIAAALVIFGLISLFSLDFTLLPDIEYPELVVMTYYPNASPEEVKTIVTAPIEQIAVSLRGVKSLHTLSREGVSVVRVLYRWGTPLGVSHIELREKMDLLKSFFPKEVQRPVIINYQVSQDAVAGISVVSDALDPRSLFLLCRKDVVAALEKVEGVARATLQGGERPEVRIALDPDKLLKYNVGVSEIRDVLMRANKNFGVGVFRDDQREYLVRVNGELADYRKLGDVVVKEEGKRLVPLKEIARVEYGSEERESNVLIDGQHALMLSLYKRPAANILYVARRIDEAVRALNERYGGSIRFQKVFDESVHIRSSLRELIFAMLLGILFTVFSVWVFLFNVRVSLVIVLSIPFSIAATFIVMKIAGISLNLLTLGGFSLAVGMIVDNAVIVTNSVFPMLDRRVKGQTQNRALFYKKVKEVIPAVFSATFTTVVVFFPVLFLTGILKIIFLQLSVVVVVSLIFSLIFSVTVVPLFLERMSLKNKGRAPKRPSWRFGALFERAYERFLSVALEQKPLFLGALFVLSAAGVLSYGAIDKRFLESVPGNHFFLKIFIKNQVPYAYTERFTRSICDILKRDESIGTIIAEVGVDRREVQRNLEGIYGPNTAVLKVYTSKEGEVSSRFIDSLRNRLRLFPGVDFIFILADDPIQRMLMRSDFEARVKVFHPSPDVLADALVRVSEFIKSSTVSQDVMCSYSLPHREQALLLDREALPLLRVDTLAVGEYLTAALAGLRAGTWKLDEYEIPILMRFQAGFQDAGLSGARKILGCSIKNDEGKAIRLADLLTLREERTPAMILRENQNTYGKVEFNTANSGNARHLFAPASQDRKGLLRFLESEGLAFQYEDQFSLLKENYRELLLALFLALFLEYAILASGFRSFSKPILVIAMIPLSIPGILLALHLLGSSLNINTFMSVIALIGLLVNNGIMLFLEYEQEKVVDAKGLIHASVRRLEPILITTLSTILALVPILFTGNRIQVNLAATLCLGLSYSTIATLVYLPMLYQAFYMGRPGKQRPLRKEVSEE